MRDSTVWEVIDSADWTVSWFKIDVGEVWSWREWLGLLEVRIKRKGIMDPTNLTGSSNDIGLPSSIAGHRQTSKLEVIVAILTTKENPSNSGILTGVVRYKDRFIASRVSDLSCNGKHDKKNQFACVTWRTCCSKCIS